MIKKISILLLSTLALWACNGKAQNAEQPDSVALADTSMDSMALAEEHIVVIPPLFEYIEAPDNLPDLQSRTDYLMDHFWDPFDFKNSKVVDQNALNHAFGVYVQTMPYASEKHVKESVKKLISKIKNNPGLSYQFTRAAEENLYGPRAEIWGDEIYISFLQNLMDNKKIDESKKKKYAGHLALLQRSAVGAAFPKINLYNNHNTATSIQQGKGITLVEFTTPFNEDFRYANLKLDISSVVNDMIDDGTLNVDVIFLNSEMPDGELPDKWNTFYSDNAADVVDLRFYPSFYILDSNNVIIAKNQPVDRAIEILEVLKER